MNTDVAARVAQVRERVATAALRCGRSPSEVCIVAVAKTQPVEAVQAAVDAGITNIGENYVQEAQAKAAKVRGPVRWHMVGHLQRNKVRAALQLFAMIHSVDRVALLEEIEARAENLGREFVDVLFEVNLGGEATKSGVAPHALGELFAALERCPRVRVRGLMCIPPPTASAERSRPFFRRLRELRDQWQAAVRGQAELTELSMGMSDDFEVAIEEGATMVRIGRALFGERPAKHQP
jgi:pyridoxal phosphate enzyme (YggS family)